MDPQMLLLRLQTTLAVLVAGGFRRRNDRGDVPGWVLVTVMTAGLVGVLYGVAKPQLTDLLRHALNSVK